MSIFRKRRGDKPDPAAPTATDAAKSPSGSETGVNPVSQMQAVAKSVLHDLLSVMAKHDPRGVNVDMALAILGTSAGAAAALTALRLAKIGEPAPTVLEGADGETYIVGDPINRWLLEGQLSYFALVAGMANHLGGDVPDLDGLVGHVASTLGGPDFGKPRLEQAAPVIEIAKAWAGPVIQLVERRVESPAHIVTTLGFATQELITFGKASVDPGRAARIAMEYAVPASKMVPTRWQAQTPPETAPKTDPE